MKHYRVYWLSRRRRILKGDWIQAKDDEDACRQATRLCDEETHAVEVWDRARPVDQIECGPRGEAA
jgi:hypothetical protein